MKQRKPAPPPSGYPRPCPLGCGHMYQFNINGWHHHVGPLKRHPHWHPEVTNPEVRKALFLEEHPNFLPKRGKETPALREKRLAESKALRRQEASALHLPVAMMEARTTMLGAMVETNAVTGLPIVAGGMSVTELTVFLRSRIKELQTVLSLLELMSPTAAAAATNPGLFERKEG